MTVCEMNYLVCKMNFLVCAMNFFVCGMNYLVYAMNYLVCAISLFGMCNHLRITFYYLIIFFVIFIFGLNNNSFYCSLYRYLKRYQFNGSRDYGSSLRPLQVIPLFLVTTKQTN